MESVEHGVSSYGCAHIAEQAQSLNAFDLQYSQSLRFRIRRTGRTAAARFQIMSPHVRKKMERLHADLSGLRNTGIATVILHYIDGEIREGVKAASKHNSSLATALLNDWDEFRASAQKDRIDAGDLVVIVGQLIEALPNAKVTLPGLRN